MALSLTSLFTPDSATSVYIGRNANCVEGFVGGSQLAVTSAVLRPLSGGFSYSSSDLARWRLRSTGTTYIRNNDVQPGSPGDWNRLLTNARRFQTTGEDAITSDNRPSQGGYARDAAFVSLVLDDAALRAGVARYLIATVSNAINDFATNRCYRYPDGGTLDGFYAEGPWLLRHILAYDYLRHDMTAADRLLVENYFRRQAYFFAGQIDWGLRFAFPRRLSGDYSVRAESAAPTTEASTWYTRRFDTNNDCKVDGLDNPSEFPTKAYVTAAGAEGPKLSWLSLWFNNRRSATTIAFGAVGLLLQDPVLINRSKRYVMEWLTFGVYPDGSEGEYSRNGNYCIPKQGLQYEQANIQAGALLAAWQNISNDSSLVHFTTREGLFGTATTATATPKSLAWLVDIKLRVVGNNIQRYMHEPWRATQMPRPDTAFSKPDIQYLNQGPAMDTFHELGLLAAAAIMPNVPVYAWISRDPAYTSVRFPGSTGNPVASGIAGWSDVFAALPAIFFLY